MMKGKSELVIHYRTKEHNEGFHNHPLHTDAVSILSYFGTNLHALSVLGDVHASHA